MTPRRPIDPAYITLVQASHRNHSTDTSHNHCRRNPTTRALPTPPSRYPYSQHPRPTYPTQLIPKLTALATRPSNIPTIQSQNMKTHMPPIQRLEFPTKQSGPKQRCELLRHGHAFV